MEYKDYYQILGCQERCHADAIKQAFWLACNILMLQGKGRRSPLQDINEAYEVLKDPCARRVINLALTGKTAPRPPNGTERFLRISCRQQRAGFREFFESLFQSAAHGAFTGMGSEGNEQDFAMRGKDQRALHHPGRSPRR